MKKIISLLLTLVMLFSLCACGAKQESEPEKTVAPEQQEESEKTDAPAEAKKETKLFVDSAGREVEVPVNIERIIPSGGMALMFVWPLAGDKLVSVDHKLSDIQTKYLGHGADDLPETGNLYRVGEELNIEEVASLDADIIIDFGEAKEDISKDLDYLQDLLGVPCVFISGTLENSADSYRMLGELLGKDEQAEEIAKYIENLVDTVHKVFETTEKKNAVILNGADALGCVASGTYFDEIWAFMLNNIAVVDESQMYASTGIDFEQLANWDPEYLFFYGSNDPEKIVDADSWQELSAVKNGKYYNVPIGPYGYVTPPSVNRYLAIIWISEVVYPGVFPWDAKEMTKEFYDLFYHYDLSDEEYTEITGLN